MRGHKKSRRGCRECKRRKVKCDETRPSCVRCRTAERQCSYIELVGHLPAPAPISSFHHSAGPSPDSRTAADSSTSSWTDTPPTGTSDLTDAVPVPVPAVQPKPKPQPDSFFAERYSLCHLELLYHFQTPATQAILTDQCGTHRMHRLICQEALKTPYLMDEVLAFAAAHKSTLAEDAEVKARYQTESTQLQSRAIGQLNIATQDVTEDNFLALFSFALLLGQHVLFEVFSTATSLPGVLDKLMQCFELHRGIRAISSRSHDRVIALSQDLFPDDWVHWQADVTDLANGDECDNLLKRIRDSDLSESTKNVYVEVAKMTQYLLDSMSSKANRRFVAVQEWLVRIPQDYILFLQQRRPEALVLLGYYAALLHRAKDYWAVGSSGRFLIRVISNHLGPYWDDWLAWPNQELSRDEG